MYIRRLASEYKKFDSDKPTDIEIRPDPDNILICHYLIKGSDDSPYKGGNYYGKLEFTKKISNGTSCCKDDNS